MKSLLTNDIVVSTGFALGPAIIVICVLLIGILFLDEDE